MISKEEANLNLFKFLMEQYLDKERLMSIEVTRAKIKWLKFEVNSEDEVKCIGEYELITSKGNILAKQEFNGYSGIKIEVPSELSKDVIEAVESTVELKIGIQKAVQEAVRIAQ